MKEEEAQGLGSRRRESGSWVRQVTRSSADSAEAMLNYRGPGGGSAIVPMDREWGQDQATHLSTSSSTLSLSNGIAF